MNPRTLKSLPSLYSLPKPLIVAALVLSCLAPVESSFATTRTVNTTADDGSANSLRRLIADSVNNDTINFGPGVTGAILLTNAAGELRIGRNLTITGPGAAVLDINGNGASRVFNVATNVTVTLSGLGISGGINIGFDGPGNDDADGIGGGILNSGTLTLENCTIANNAVLGDSEDTGGDGDGGGIFSFGTLTLVNCELSNNFAEGNVDDVGIYAGSGEGGAIGSAGVLVMTNCTVDGNNSVGASGEGTSGGYASGGGILCGGLTVLANCTIAGNVCYGGMGMVIGGGANGAGIDNEGGALTLISCTISGNTASCGDGTEIGGTAAGGGLCAGGGTCTLQNTIVGLNEALSTGLSDGSVGEGPDVSGNVTSGGFNLIGETDGSTGWITGGNGADLTGTISTPLDPGLGPLKINGGAMPTMALSPTSAAIDQGFSFGLTTDQRGLPRPYDYPDVANAPGGDGSDIGAIEVNPQRPILTLYPGLTHLNLAWSENEPGTGPLNGGPFFGPVELFDLGGGGTAMTSFMPVRYLNSINMYVGKAMPMLMMPGDQMKFYRLAGPATNVNFIPPAATTAATQITTNAATLNGTTTPLGDGTRYWFVYGADTNYGQSTLTNSLDTATNFVQLSQTINGLAALTIYHFQLMVTDSDGLQYGGDQSFTTPAPPPPPPALVTLAASGITQNSAVLNGSIDGYGEPDAAYFEYGLDASYGNNTYSGQFYGDGYFQDFTNIVAGLAPGTTYHYRAVGFTLAGEGYGQDETFATDAGSVALPTVQTLAASAVTETGATLNGSVNPNGSATTVFFDWGADTTYGNVTTQTAIGTAVQNDFQAPLSGLNAYTTYHYRIGAVNAGGITYGADATFTTGWLPVPPTLVSPGTANAGSPGLATITPTFTWTGASPAVSFDLTILGYPKGNVVWVESVHGTSYSLPGGILANGTAYQWYMTSFDSLGHESSPSASLYFTTASVPTVVTLPATNFVGSTFVKLSGSVNPNGATTMAYFEYGTTTNYGSVTTQTGIGVAAQTFTATVGGLTAGATYHYRVDAVNGIGPSYGSDVTFVAP